MGTLFVRKSKVGDWDQVSTDTAEDLMFPADVLADLLDAENEISVWEVNDPPGSELDDLIAALNSPTASDLSDVTYRVISKWRLDKLNLRLKATPGDSLNSQLNKSGRHRVIQVKTVGEVIKLAKAFKERTAQSFGRPYVMQRFAQALQQKQISTNRVQAALWGKLIDGGFLEVMTPPMQTQSAESSASQPSNVFSPTGAATPKQKAEDAVPKEVPPSAAKPSID